MLGKHSGTWGGSWKLGQSNNNKINADVASVMVFDAAIPIEDLEQMHNVTIIPPFTNDALRRAVKDYLAGGARKEDIVKKYGEINNWDVSKVTDMSHMFKDSFNQPLNKWNVSKVTNMRGMFWTCRSFNQPLNNWNVSNVTTMGLMFQDATSFNQPLNNWNVSNVTDMSWMFAGATSFNQPINQWNLNSSPNMYRMFRGATSFNPLNSNVTRMRGMPYELVNEITNYHPLLRTRGPRWT